MITQWLRTYLAARPNATDQQLSDYLFWHHFDAVNSMDKARNAVRDFRERAQHTSPA